MSPPHRRHLQVVCLLIASGFCSLAGGSVLEECADFLWGFEFSSTPGAYSDASQARFYDCVEMQRKAAGPDQELIAGVHYPTYLRSLGPSSSFPVSLDRWQLLKRCQQLAPSFANSEGVSACCQTGTAANCWSQAESLAEACCRAAHSAAGSNELDPARLLVLTPAFDVNVGSRMRQEGTFHVGQSYGLQSLCGPGDIVVDAGANLGGFTLPLALRVGERGRVYAFEPFRRLFQQLTANVALNGLGNVFTHNVALGGQDEKLRLRQPDLARFNLPSSMQVRTQGYSESVESGRKWTLFYEEGPGEEVEVRRLDSFEFPSLRLLKIDVEDMEAEVVAGAVRTITLHRPIIWAENARLFEQGDHSFLEAMSKLEYDCSQVEGFEWELLCVPHGSPPVQLIFP